MITSANRRRERRAREGATSVESAALACVVAMVGVCGLTVLGAAMGRVLIGEQHHGQASGPAPMVTGAQAASFEALKLFDDARYVVEGAAKVEGHLPPPVTSPVTPSVVDLSVDWRPAPNYDTRTVPQDFMVNADFVNPRIEGEVARAQNDAILRGVSGDAPPRLINCQKVAAATDLMLGGAGPCQALRNFGRSAAGDDSLELDALTTLLGGPFPFDAFMGGELGRFQVNQAVQSWGPGGKGLLILRHGSGTTHIQNVANIDGVAVLLENQALTPDWWLWQRFDTADATYLVRTKDMPEGTRAELRNQLLLRRHDLFGATVAALDQPIQEALADRLARVARGLRKRLSQAQVPSPGGASPAVFTAKSPAGDAVPHLLNPDFVNPKVPGEPQQVINPRIPEARDKPASPRRINCQKVVATTDVMLGGGGPCQALRNYGQLPNGEVDSASSAELARQLGGRGAVLSYTGRTISRRTIGDAIREMGPGAKGIVSLSRHGVGHLRNFANVAGMPVLIDNQFRTAVSHWIAVDNALEVQLFRTLNMPAHVMEELRQYLLATPDYVGFLDR